MVVYTMVESSTKKDEVEWVDEAYDNYEKYMKSQEVAMMYGEFSRIKLMTR